MPLLPSHKHTARLNFFFVCSVFFLKKEIINYLYEVTLPKLSALLKSKKGNDDDEEDDAKEQAPRVKEQKKVFRFQEIFPESSDELIDDSEDELEAEGSESF